MSAAAGLESFRSQFAARIARLPGDEERRREALECALAMGIPTTRDEEWRFTPLRRLSQLAFTPELPEPLIEPGAEEAAAFIGEAHRIAFRNGVFEPRDSALAELPAGVRIEPLRTALEREPSLAARVGELADPKAGFFSALNRALFADGVSIEVGEGVSLGRPLHVLARVQASGAPLAIHSRHLIRVGAGSKVTIMEQTLGLPGEASFSNPVTELWLERDANVEHIKLQLEAGGTMHLAALCARQEAGSRLIQHSLALGAALARFEIRCDLVGEGAHTGLRGLYLGRGSQLLDHHTTIDHATPHTTSDELYKGILAERATGVFHGSIGVRPHAQKISALQQNRNLLLSDRAVIHTKPHLEIHADDVRCSHGATIGQLDPDALFYLRSRGVREADARALLTYAFASEILHALPVPRLRERLEREVLDWLPGSEPR